MGRKKIPFYLRQPIDRQAAMSLSYSGPASAISERPRYSGSNDGLSHRGITQASLRVSLTMIKAIKNQKLTCQDCKKLGFYTEERCMLCKLSEPNRKKMTASYGRRAKITVHRIGKIKQKRKKKNAQNNRGNNE